MVARDGIEPPTRGFSHRRARLFHLSFNHLPGRLLPDLHDNARPRTTDSRKSDAVRATNPTPVSVHSGLWAPPGQILHAVPYPRTVWLTSRMTALFLQQCPNEPVSGDLGNRLKPRDAGISGGSGLTSATLSAVSSTEPVNIPTMFDLPVRR
jgi:hypothetical protein